MATVYRAYDKRLDRTVAVKVMHPHLADMADFVARFRREARAAAKLSHPGVVAVYDQGSVDGVAYLVMEFVEGQSLRDLMNAESLSAKEALYYTTQVLRPLAAAHRAGLVHRDVKPENVMLPPDGSLPKVTDFGLARAITETTQTSTGNVLGTVAYLAPELITDGASMPRADIFSVGIMLYEMLTGSQPFAGQTPIHIAFCNVHEDVPEPSGAVPQLPRSLDNLVTTFTMRNPELRPADGDEALRLLREVQADLSEDDLAIHPPRRSAPALQQQDTPAMEAPLGAASALVSAATADSAEDTPAEIQHTKAIEVGAQTVALPVGAIVRQSDDAAAAPPKKKHTRRKVLGALLLLGAAGGAGYGGYWYLTEGPGRRIPVPDVVGMQQDAAREQVESADLIWQDPQREYSDTVTAGEVISVEPSPGSELPENGIVTATVSLGVEQQTIPELAGLEQDAAETALTDTDLTLGEVNEEYSETVPAGQIIACDPEAGTEVDHGSQVNITVSLGREPIDIPDVTGMSQSQAEAALADAELTVGEISTAYSDSVAEGDVISSSPQAAEKSAYRGDAISLVVSLGPEMVEIPSVTGMSETEAISALEDAGLTVTVSEVLGGIFGTARYTDPEAGTSVRKGSEVTLYVV